MTALSSMSYPGVSDERSSLLPLPDDKASIPVPTITRFSQLEDPPEKQKLRAEYKGRGLWPWLWLCTHMILDTILLTLLTCAVLVCLVLLSPVFLFCTILQRIHVAHMQYRAPPSKQRVAVVGGGWSGLQCMAQLHELGVGVSPNDDGYVKGFERCDRWGGTWHPDLRYHSLQIHGAMWATSFKDFPYSKEQDINDGKVLGEEVLRYVDRFGTEKNLMDSYTFNAKVVEIKYSTGAEGLGSSEREATLVLQHSVTGEVWTEGPFDLVIYASLASEPHIPDIPGRKEFKGEVYHSIDFKKKLYDNIVQSGKKVIVVGGSKAGCDLALCFQRNGYDKFCWLYRTPYLFWKYEVMFHNRSLINILRGLTTMIGLLMGIVSERLTAWIFWANGIAVTHGDNSRPHDIWSKFHYGVLCPKQRRDLSLIPKDCIVRGNPQVFTDTGLQLSDGTIVEADVVLFATGCESGIDKIRLTKTSRNSLNTLYTLRPTTPLLDHFIIPEFPVLANATSLWTTLGPVRAVNAADMAVYHLCVRRHLTEQEMQYSTMRQFGKTNSVKGFIFNNKKGGTINAFLWMHVDLLWRGNENIADFFIHMFELFCLGKQTALKMHLPKLKQY